jgi:hypothetical protein
MPETDFKYMADAARRQQTTETLAKLLQRQAQARTPQRRSKSLSTWIRLLL